VAPGLAAPPRPVESPAFPRFVIGPVADVSVAHAYYLPIICYVVVLLYGAKLYKVRRA
jgi:FHS family L-fucose permease-like MFS transporter